MEKIRLGIVGLGWMGSYLAQLTTMPDVELTAAADIDEKRLREITSYYRIKEAFKNYEDLLDSGVDAVIVATPPKFHVEPSVGALKRGMYVFLEKPMATNLNEAVRIYQAAKQSNAELMLAFSLRYHPMYIDIAEIIEEKGLGNPLSLWHAAFGRIPKNPWIGKREVSGGMINENGVHVLYVFRWIGGNVKKAYARTATFTSGVNIEDSAVAVLEHENNAISTLIQCWHCTHFWRRWGMVFEGGTLTIDGYLGGTCKISLRNARVTKTCTYPNSIDEMYRSELRHFINCIKEGKKPLTNEEDGLYAQVLVEAIYASANDGIPKDINSLLSKVL